MSQRIVSKQEREIRKLAVEEGLEVMGIKLRNRHRFMIVRNAEGQEWQCPFNPVSTFNRDTKNTRANFRRFARGQTQGLLRERQFA